MSLLTELDKLILDIERDQDKEPHHQEHDCGQTVLNMLRVCSTTMAEREVCVNEAASLIAFFGTTGAERTDILKRADAWLERYQYDNGKINFKQFVDLPDPEKNT